MTTRFFVIGTVFALIGTSVWFAMSAPAPSVMHVRVYAEKAPIFGIAGTNPVALRTAVNELDDAVQELADIQADDAQKELMQSIYPISFLSALADLEEARQKLLSSGDDADAETYRKLARVAVDHRREDTTRFRKAVEAALPAVPKNARFPSFGGTLSVSRILEAATQAEDVRAYELQLACLEGDFNVCKEPSAPLSEYPLANDPKELSVPPLVEEILSLRNKFLNTTEPDTRTLVALETSTCLASKNAPYYMTVHPDGTVRYVGDMFFAATANSEGPTMQHMRDVLGVEYAVLNPMNYYTCPDLLTDIAAAHAIMATRVFARDNPQLALVEREHFLKGSVLREDLAVRYLRAVLADPQLSETTPAYQNAHEIVLMFEKRSAGLEHIVKDIVSVTRNDVRLAREGIPFELRAEKLLLSHSAFPSLLLAHGPKMRQILYETHSVQDTQAFLPYALQYSELRNTVPRDKLIADFRAFLSMEGKLPSNTAQ